MAQNITADEAQDENKFAYDVEVGCDCPNCGGEDTATQSQTAELFDDESGYSSICKDCGFHFRAFTIASDDGSVNFDEFEKGDDVTVSYEMISEGFTNNVDGSVADIFETERHNDTLKMVIETDGPQIELEESSYSSGGLARVGGKLVGMGVEVEHK